MPTAASAKAREAAQAPANGRIAVVDIGSNSIRLVVFDRLVRTPLPVFNEKVLCALGRGLDATGRLNEAGVGLALDNLERFARLARAMQVARLSLLATAAVRDAENGPEFVAEVERRCGCKVEVISGEEEATLSARGVLAGMPYARGITGDLGGGSLELVALADGKTGSHATLPLGPLRLPESMVEDREAARDYVDKHLATVPWLADCAGRDFYPVGGAWRTLARLQMEQVEYPLHVIHEYALQRAEAEELARVMGRMGRRSLAAVAGVSRRRMEVLPFAALLLERILRIAKPARVVFSANGLREGFVFAQLSREEQRKDPLLVACAELGAGAARSPDLAPLLDEWVEPLLADDDAAARRLRLAVCHISDIAWREHPDYRVEQSFERVLRLPVGGVSHPQRVALAVAVAARYGGGFDTEVMQPFLPLLPEEEQQRMRVLGLALRLAYSLCGATPALLPRAALRLEKNAVALVLRRGDKVMVGESVQRRLDALGRALDRPTAVREE